MMNFKEGLLYAYRTRRTDGEVTDPFYLYCRLSDLCFATYEDKRKVRLFYAVDKRVCIFETLLKYGGQGEQELLQWYACVSGLLSEDAYKKLVACAVWVTEVAQAPDGETTKEIPVAKTAAKPVQKTAQKTAVKPVQKTVEKVVRTGEDESPTNPKIENNLIPAPPKLQKITPVKVQKAPESETKETRTLLTSSSFGFINDVKIFLIVGGALLLATILAGAIFAVCGLCGRHLTWTSWQWLLGIVGGGWLAFAVGTLLYLLHDSLTCDYTVSGLIALGGVLLLNFLLLIIFRGNYKILFGCFSVWGILSAAGVSVWCRFDFEDDFVVLYAVAAVIFAGVFTAGLIWL